VSFIKLIGFDPDLERSGRILDALDTALW